MQYPTGNLIFPIKTGINFIGSAAGANVVLKDHGVSGLHALIEISDDGTEHFIEDLASTNGTLYGSLMLFEYKMYQLAHQKELTFGPTRAIYEIIVLFIHAGQDK